jgi:hypothetical protein
MYTYQFELKPEFELETNTLSRSNIMDNLLLRMTEFLQARHQFESGKDQIQVTDYIFNLRHPELKRIYRPHSDRQVIDKRYLKEWEDIFLNIVNPIFFSLPHQSQKLGPVTKPSPTSQQKDGMLEFLKWLLNHIGRSRE